MIHLKFRYTFEPVDDKAEEQKWPKTAGVTLKDSRGLVADGEINNGDEREAGAGNGEDHLNEDEIRARTDFWGVLHGVFIDRLSSGSH